MVNNTNNYEVPNIICASSNAEYPEESVTVILTVLFALHIWSTSKQDVHLNIAATSMICLLAAVQYSLMFGRMSFQLIQARYLNLFAGDD